MMPLETVEQKRERIMKSVDGYDPLMKSDVYYAFNDSPSVAISKTGAELKAKISVKLAEYDSKYALLEAKIASMKPVLVAAGISFQEEEYGHQRAKYPSSKLKEYDTLSGKEGLSDEEYYELDSLVSEYNDYIYTCKDINKDRKTMKILMEGLVDKTSYKLTVSQLSVFEKGVHQYDPDRIEKAAKMKMLSEEELEKIARQLSSEELSRTAEGSKHEHHRTAAHKEINRRQAEEASQGIPEEKMLDHYVDEEEEGPDENAVRGQRTAQSMAKFLSKMPDPGPDNYDSHLEHWKSVVDGAPDDHKEHYQKVYDKVSKYKERNDKKNAKKAERYDKQKEKMKNKSAWDELFGDDGGMGDITKAKAGVYKDTPQNRKLNRVGQKYGNAKKDDDKGDQKSGKKEEGGDKKYTQADLDALQKLYDDPQHADIKDKIADKMKEVAAQVHGTGQGGSTKSGGGEKQESSKDSGKDDGWVSTKDKVADAKQMGMESAKNGESADDAHKHEGLNKLIQGSSATDAQKYIDAYHMGHDEHTQSQGGDGPEEGSVEARAEEFDIDVDDLKDMEDIAASELESVEDYGYGSGQTYVFADGSEYLVYDDESDARGGAEEYLEQLIDEMGPEAFNPDFANQYLTISDTDKNLLADDLRESDRDYVEEEVRDENPDADDDEISSLVEEALDAKYDEHVEGLDSDPKDYLVNQLGIYDDESFAQASFVSYDNDQMISDAIDIDGIEHSLSTYDGSVNQTTSGKLMYRTN